jgi:hypothetical protein
MLSHFTAEYFLLNDPTSPTASTGQALFSKKPQSLRDNNILNYLQVDGINKNC